MSEWTLTYDAYEPAGEGLREALTALGNGYFVTRGAVASTPADEVHYPGTYLAGGYNRLTTQIEGRTIENEDLVNLPNWLLLRIRIDDGPWLTPDDVQILAYRHELDLRAGVATRMVHFRDAEGRTTRWFERRLVSMAEAHLAGLEVTIRAEDWSGRLTIESAIDGRVTNAGVARYRALSSRHLEPVRTDEPDADTILLQSRFRQARTEVALAARTRIYLDERPVSPPRRTVGEPDLIAHEIAIDVAEGADVLVEKVVALHTSRDVAISEAGLAARDAVAHAGRFGALLDEHALAWRHLWDDCGIELESDVDHHQLPMKIRLSIFHLLQTVSHHSIPLDSGVPARGWHGEAYRGHIFWDELFILPYLTFRIPALTRALLKYRYRRLPAARQLARESGLRGAMFPWQSGSSGREESQRLHLNPRSHRWLPDETFRQRHIGAAIAYNVWQYYEITDDHEFMYFYGAELFLEIARFWVSVATYDARLERYDIKGVMGPDEFHTAYPDAGEGGLDNNAYTNVMVAWLLVRALDVLDSLPDERRRKLCEQIGLTVEEIEQFDELSRRLKIPFHDHDIISQFEGYEHLLEFDWEGARGRYDDIQRLDRILEAEGDSVNRYKASKQADVLMLFYLFSADELRQLFERLGYPFDASTIPRNIDYYLARTSHGSTLSLMVHGWVLSRATRPGSFEMFVQTVEADLRDIQGGTTAEGIHLGAMAGSVDIVQRCYTGLEPRGGVLHFNPSLPQQIDCLRMRIRYRRQLLDVVVDRERLTITSRRFTALPITVAYRGQFREMSPGDSYSFRLIRPLPTGAICAPRRSLIDQPG
ncbi:MAG TPA: glycosyl hydrolase family 65 protein [Geminicoccaceae bacterium]